MGGQVTGSAVLSQLNWFLVVSVLYSKCVVVGCRAAQWLCRSGFCARNQKVAGAQSLQGLANHDL